MFSKNIIVLLCIVYFTTAELSNPQVTKELMINYHISRAPITDSHLVETREIKDKIYVLIKSHDWQELFNKYNDKEGSISATNLQKLLFEEFHGFLTVRQAKRYIKLINLKESNQIGLEQLKKMIPVIAVLSKREKSVDKLIMIIVQKKRYGNSTISRDTFLSEVDLHFKKLFSDKTEISEVLHLVDQNGNVPIKWRKFEKVKEMLAASQELEMGYGKYCTFDEDKSGVIDAYELVKGYNINKPEMNSLMRVYDSNCDGVIDFPEFLIMIMSAMQVYYLESLLDFTHELKPTQDSLNI